MTPSTNEIILGIDLGTTFSLVAFADEAGPQVIRDANGEARLPSVLGFGPDGRVTVGWDARRHAVENPLHTVYSIKRLIGLSIDDLKNDLPHLPYHVVGDERQTVKVEIDGRLLSPEELSSLVLRELKLRAERHFGRPIGKAVITVPAYFDDAQRQATRHAGRLAELEVVRIVNEPTAAALAYGIGLHDVDRAGRPASLSIGDQSKCGGDAQQNDAGPPATSLIAVYDLGGGTFDVSILRLSGDVFEVISTHGDTHLGGDDFDREIVALVQREVTEQFGIDIESPATKQALRLLAEEVKIRLSTEEYARIELDLGNGRTYRRSILRPEFEALVEPFVNRTLDACRRALADARCAPSEVEQVVLVGGSSRIPRVRRGVEALFGRKPYTAMNPDEVVALGAAVLAQILAGRGREGLLLDVTPLSLGIETMGGAMGKLIMRNTRIPCRVVEQFTTFVDGQANVKINVLQGERELAVDCRSLATFDLRGIPPMPAGIPKIDVSFLIDANGILNVSAREVRSGVEASIQVIPSRGLTREEVRRIERDSIHFAREDMTAHRLIDLRNQVAFDAHKTEQALKRFGHLISAPEGAAIAESIRVLRRLAETTGEADRLHQALKEFGRLTEPLARVAVTALLSDAGAPAEGLTTQTTEK